MDGLTGERDGVTGCDRSQVVTAGDEAGLTCDRKGVNCTAGQLPTCHANHPPPVPGVPEKALQTFDFDAPPPLGTVVMFHGQRYVMAGVGMIERQEAPDVEAGLWETHCARCAGLFLARMPFPSTHGTRRCEVCRTVERGRV